MEKLAYLEQAELVNSEVDTKNVYDSNITGSQSSTTYEVIIERDLDLRKLYAQHVSDFLSSPGSDTAAAANGAGGITNKAFSSFY